MKEILKVLNSFREEGYIDKEIELAIKKLVLNKKITKEQGAIIIHILWSTSNRYKIYKC